MNLDDLMPLHVVLWSRSQQCFHIELVSQMIVRNMQICFEDRPIDYITLAFANSYEEATDTANTLKRKLAEYKEKHRK